MRDISDGRFGGLVPLQRLDLVNQQVEVQEAEAQPPDIQLEDIVADDGGINLPGSDGPVNVEDLTDEQLAQLQALSQQFDPDVIRAAGRARVLPGPVQDFLGLSDSSRLDDQAARQLRDIATAEGERRQQAADLAELERQRDLQTYGASSPRVLGTSLLEAQANVFNASALTEIDRIRSRAEDYFSTQERTFVNRSRSTERLLRSAIADTQAFMDANFGEGFDLTDSEIAALQQVYRERLDTVRELRTEAVDSLRTLQTAVEAGDYSLLPENLRPTEQQIFQLERENRIRARVENEVAPQLLDLMQSTSLGDRFVVEAVRAHMNPNISTTRADAYVARLFGIPDGRLIDQEASAERRRLILERAEAEGREVDPSELLVTGPPLFDEQTQEIMHQRVRDLVGLVIDDDVTVSGDDRVTFNYLGEDLLFLLDNFELGMQGNFDEVFEERTGAFRGPQDIIANQANAATVRNSPVDEDGNALVGFIGDEEDLIDPFIVLGDSE